MTRALRGASLLGLLAVGLTATPARAVTTLTVNLSTTLGPVTHAASGSLYGVTEMLPADVTGLIAPLRPNMFTNPAANVQQPRGDAIAVAQKVAPTGAKVTIRLADWFPSWPYAFTNMADWLDKLGQTVTRKKASGVDNYYGYEIWNEPDGTWTSSTTFNDFWKQSYDKLRELDPTAKIIGPSYSFYNASTVSSFLTFAQSNDCLPDIISWHELGGANATANFQGYRALEKQLGIGPLPISINEYSGKDHIDDEGQPGASAPLIAKFERFRIDTACISYWDVSHAGRLGSLLASDTARNGGWWFYKWYGDMSGNMVSTTPPAPNDVATLDGFANWDASTGSASVLLAGVNDGTLQIVVKGFAAASSSASEVHAVVERAPFTSRTTSVTATVALSMADLAIANDQVSVTVSGTNNSDGYRLLLTGLGGGTGGMAGAGGAGTAGNSGSATVGGAAGSGLGGRGSPGGHGGVAGDSTRAGASGATATAGVGASGMATQGGSSGAPSAASGRGAMGSGGASGGASGVAANGGRAVGGGAPGTGAESSTPKESPAASTGCGCTLPRGASDLDSLAVALGMAGAVASRRRRRAVRYAR